MERTSTAKARTLSATTPKIISLISPGREARKDQARSNNRGAMRLWKKHRPSTGKRMIENKALAPDTLTVVKRQNCKITRNTLKSRHLFQAKRGILFLRICYPRNREQKPA